MYRLPSLNEHLNEAATDVAHMGKVDHDNQRIKFPNIGQMNSAIEDIKNKVVTARTKVPRYSQVGKSSALKFDNSAAFKQAVKILSK